MWWRPLSWHNRIYGDTPLFGHVFSSEIGFPTLSRPASFLVFVRICLMKLSQIGGRICQMTPLLRIYHPAPNPRPASADKSSAKLRSWVGKKKKVGVGSIYHEKRKTVSVWHHPRINPFLIIGDRCLLLINHDFSPLSHTHVKVPRILLGSQNSSGKIWDAVPDFGNLTPTTHLRQTSSSINQPGICFLVKHLGYCKLFLCVSGV